MTRPIIVTGADGMLGSAVVRAGIRNGVDVRGLSRHDLDITDMRQVEEVLGSYPYATVINCAGVVRGRQDVDEGRLVLVNSTGPQRLARNANRLLHVSTDCVFDGRISEGAYTETSPPCPEDDYGRWKLYGEVTWSPHLTVRVSFVGLGQRGLIQWLLRHPVGTAVSGYRDWFWNGWTASALACFLLPVAMDPEITGLIHLPGPEVITKGWLLSEVAKRLRPDLHVFQCEGEPGPRRMVLASNYLSDIIPDDTWSRMLDELEEEYRT